MFKRFSQKALTFALILGVSGEYAFSQSQQYKRAKPSTRATKKLGKGKVKAKAKSDKLDISDVEKKYWAPKDTDFSVVQNRAYAKDHRFALSATFGPLINDVFSDGNGLSMTANYFFSERHGIELQYMSVDATDSAATDTFVNELSSGVRPDFGRIKSYSGVGYNFIPVYAKMSLLGKRIIYYDLSITPGLGMTGFDQILLTGNDSMSSLSFSLDISQFFFLTEHIALRVDLKNMWFKEEVKRYNTGTVVNEQTSNVTVFLVGGTLFF